LTRQCCLPQPADNDAARIINMQNEGKDFSLIASLPEGFTDKF